MQGRSQYHSVPAAETRATSDDPLNAFGIDAKLKDEMSAAAQKRLCCRRVGDGVLGVISSGMIATDA